MEIKKTKELCELRAIPTNKKDFQFIQAHDNLEKKWVSVESILKLTEKELIDEVRKLHVNKGE